tara:strand:+ start:279 stop:926 length:648 start_codon:yes stop_codon:yes gene_type:complete
MGRPAPSGSSDAPMTTRSTVIPKKSVVTKIKDEASTMITSRRKAAYNVANIIPGMEEGLVKNRTDYKNYLKEKGNIPDFLNVDDKTLGSFDTFEQIRNFNPIQTKPNSNTLNYADYLAKEKGNYNLKNAGNVGNSNNGGGSNGPAKPIVLDSVTNNAPTTVEVSQATATDATADTIQTRKKRAKAIGRSMTILTSSTGVKSDDKLTLGKKSLLGA